MTLLLFVAWAMGTQAPDSVARARMGDAVTALGDSLSALAGASATFSRDLDRSSRQAVLARAADVRVRCVGARIAAGEVDRVYAANAPAFAGDRGMPEYRRELSRLEAELARCESEWQTPYSAATADSLRAWGPHRLSRIEAAARRHAAAAAQLPYDKPRSRPRAGVGR
ncbi:MAG TPA: hypothetical protein VLB49_15190 [Gemmatimonadales bacterium]|nr:hypothetical protein [Gemmatimonadales bacterium]